MDGCRESNLKMVVMVVVMVMGCVDAVGKMIVMMVCGKGRKVVWWWW